MTHKTQLQYYIFVMKSILSQLCLIAYILPKAQPKANSYWLHIPYFLQNCKKGKPGEMDLPYLKTISQVLNPLLRFWIH